MLRFKTEAIVMSTKAEQVTDFFVNCNDKIYSAWWPGEHIEFHTIQSRAGVVGSIVYFDEKVGRRRLKFQSLITRYTRGKNLEYQMIQTVKLPAYLSMEFTDRDGNVGVCHSLNIGFNGFFKCLDPIIRLFVPRSLITDLDAHAKEEFSRLSSHLNHDNQLIQINNKLK